MIWLTQAWAQLKCLLQRLLDSRDPSADSVALCGLVLAGSMAFAIVIVAIGTAFGVEAKFDFQGLGIGAGALLGGFASGQGARSLMSRKGQSTAEEGPK